MLATSFCRSGGGAAALNAARRPALSVAVYTDAVEIGGAEQALATLVANLDRGIQLTILGVSGAVVSFVAAGRPDAVTAVLPEARRAIDLNALRAHVAALRAVRPHVVHANLASPWACRYGILAARLIPRVRIVAVVHSPSEASSRPQRALRRLTAGRVVAHVAVGERAARLVENLLGLREGSVRTIHNGVADIPVEPAPRLDAESLLTWVGRIDRHKGLDVLLHALKRLPTVTAVLVGQGPDRLRLEDLAAELRIADRVVFTGWIEEPRAYVASSDLFVLPSRIEAFPLSILEAMLVEVPVVASDVGSVREAVIPQMTGILVRAGDVGDLASAIASLLSDGEARRRMGRAGRALVLERFTVRAMTRAYERLYAEVAR